MPGFQKRCPGKITIQDLKKRSLGEISVRGLWARSQQVSMQGPCSRSLYESSGASSLEELSWQDVCKRHLGKIPATSLCNVFVQNLCKRSPGKISVQDLDKSSVGKISARGLLARSLNKISKRGLLARFLYKLPIRSLLARFLYEMPRFVRQSLLDGSHKSSATIHSHVTDL